MEWSKERDNLHRLIVIEKKSYLSIAKMYGVSNTFIKKKAIELGIPIESRRKINPSEHSSKIRIKHFCLNCGREIESERVHKFCSFVCSCEYHKKEKYRYYLEHQEDFVGKEISYDWLKPIILEEQNHTCAIDGCDCKDFWNGKELHFVLDHINGDATDNRRSNIRLVCPNCDSQLDTYKSRNRGKSTRKYKPYSIGK